MAEPKMDLVRRTFHMLGAGTKEYVTDTFGSTLKQVREQSLSVKNEVLHDVVTSAQDGYNKIRRYTHVKNILDWFFDGSDQIESEYVDDEWDSGEPSMGEDAGDDDVSRDNAPAVLSADSMKSIASKQTAALYRVSGKQSEVSIANTAEIVKTLDTRTAELVKAISSVNTSLNTLTNSFNAFTKAYFEGEEKKFTYYASENNNKEQYRDPNTVLDSSNRLNLENITKTIKERTVDSTVNTVKGFLSQIGNSTTERISFLLQNTVGEFVKIGGKSLNDIGERFDATVNAVVQGSLSTLLNNDIFKRFVGDFTHSQVGTDLRGYLKNGYNDKRANFDNMTRQTIIDIIPGYLKKITEGITGKTWNINERGQLTTRNENTFSRISKYAFNSTGIYGDDADTILKAVRSIDYKLNQSDVDLVLKAISISLVFSGKSFINPAMVAADTSLIAQVIVTLMNATGKRDDEYWTNIVRGVLMKLDSDPVMKQSFIESVNANISNVQKQQFQLVNSNPRVAHDMEASGGSLTIDMARDQLRRDRNRRLESYGLPTVPSNQEADGTVTDASGKAVANVSKVNKFSDLTTLDYTRGIFTLLNRGINVRVDPSDKPFKPIRLTHRETGPALESLEVSKHTEKLAEKSGSFLKEMNELLMPRGLRISMQHFARDIGQQMGVYDPNVKDEHGNQISMFDQVKRNILKPLTSKVDLYGNQALNYVFGDKVQDKDADGNDITRRQGGLLQPVRDKFGTMKQNITDDIKSIGESYNRKMMLRDAKNELKETVSYVQGMDNTEGSAENDDRIAAQHVFALMQTAVADGDGSQDLGRINEAINTIQDPGLRSRLQRSVIPMVQATGERTEKKSLLGKLLSGGLSLTKKIFSPIISVLKAGFNVVKSIGSKILSLIGRGIKSGVRDITTGASNVWRALVGQSATYDAEGNVIAPETRGLFGSMRDSIANRRDRKAREAYAKEVSGIVSPAIGSSGVNQEAERQKLEAAQKEADAKIKAAEAKASEAESKAEKKSLGQRISDWNPLTRIYQNSEFLSGFTQSFREAKMKREAARVENLKAETVADRETEKLTKAVEGSKKSVLTDIRDIINKIFTKMDTEESPENTVTDDTATPEVDESSTDESEKSKVTTASEDESEKLQQSQNDEKSKVTAASENGGTPVTTTTTPTTTPTDTSTTDTSANAKAGSKYSVGQALGGITAMLGGVFKIIMTILMSIEGFKVLINFVKDAFIEAIQPLSKLFLQLKKAITPVIKSLAGIVSTIAEGLSTIVGVFVDLLQPVLESTSPILDMIGEVLPGLLECVSILLKVIMAPLMGIMQAVIVPVLRQVANALEVIQGIIQASVGYIITGLGNILKVVSLLLPKILGGGAIKDKGKELVEQGGALMAEGRKNIGSGLKKFVTTAVEQMNPVAMTKTFATTTIDSIANDGNTETSEKSSRTNTPYDGTGGSVMDGVVASGDVNSHNVNSSSKIYNTYNTWGSGDKLNQKSYGNYLNMGNRGCGPIALADVYARRTGRSIDPATLAKRMYGAGMYDPGRGTSVNGLIAAGKAMGMNTHVGRVTSRLLSTASPNNPITIIGSGSGYTTKSGNNHYMNVVGSKNGISYVANPLTGRVDRAYTSSLVSGSKYGLYGSGDSDDTLDRFNLGDGFMDAFKDLTSTAGRILGIFRTDEKSTSDEVNDSIQAEKDKEAAYQIKMNATDESGNSTFDESAVTTAALNKCREDNPRNDGESVAAYEKRISKVFTANSNRYIRDAAYSMYGDQVQQSALNKIQSNLSIVNSGISLANSIAEDMDSYGSSYMNGGFGQMTGSTNKEKVWSYLRTLGMNPKGVAGLMGCFQYESGFESNNLENTYQSKFGYGTSKSGDERYTADVNSGTESERAFVSGRNNPEKVGYGIAQFTSSGLKQGLYNATVKNGKSIDDLQTQLEFVVQCLKDRGIYDMINNASTPTEANKYFLWKYEAGTGYDSDEAVLSAYNWINKETDGYANGVLARHGAAEEFYKQFKDWNPSAEASQGDVISAAAEVFRSYKRANPQGTYMNSTFGDLILTNGQVIQDFRPDCSGIMSAAIKSMGYNIGVGNRTGFRCADISRLSSNSVITDSDGNASSDWIIGQFDPSDRQPGDIDVNYKHMGMYITDKNGQARGLDGGSTRGINQSATAADQYLSGQPWKDLLHWTIQSHGDSESPAPTAYIRYVGAPSEESEYNEPSGTSKPSWAPSSPGDVPSYSELQDMLKEFHRTMDSRNSNESAQRVLDAKKNYAEITTPVLPSYDDGSSTTTSTTVHPYNIYGSGDVDGFDWFGLTDQPDKQPIVINKYSVSQNKQSQTEKLNMILNNTYNVRSERIEELLEKILDAIEDDNDKPKSGGNIGTSRSSAPNLFSDSSIPKQVQRLYS